MRRNTILLGALFSLLAVAVAVNAVESTSWGKVKSLLTSSPAPAGKATSLPPTSS
ncbi:MAG: hypothetical protein IH991_10200 [Planctomycetes bacterium]|nr:hypothetical protein [Planctomycetota bacterium]